MISATVERQDLHRASKIILASSGAPSLPITAQAVVSFDPSRQAVTIRASNLETEAVWSMPSSEVNGTGEFTLPAKLLARSVAAMNGLSATFTVNTGKATSRLSVLRQEVAFGGADLTAMPPFLSRARQQAVAWEATFATNQFLAALRAAGPTAATEEYRPILQAVKIVPVDGAHADFVAADGFRLCRAVVPIVNATPSDGHDLAIHLPRGIVKLATTIAAMKLDKTVTVKIVTGIPGSDEDSPTFRYVVVQCGPCEVWSHPIMGTYLNYQQLIPKAFSVAAEVAGFDIKASVKLLKATKSSAQARSSIVRLELDERSQRVVLSSKDPSESSQARVVIPATVEVDDKILPDVYAGRIAVDVEYLAGAVEACEDKAVVKIMLSGGPSSPLSVQHVVKGVRVDSVVMPMFVQWETGWRSENMELFKLTAREQQSLAVA